MKRHLFIIFLLPFFIFSLENINFPKGEQASAVPDVSKIDQIAIPLLLNYQGKLTDNVGNPVRDSFYSITFRLYTVSTGGTPFWGETKTIETRGGLFHTLLGSVNPITSLPLDGNCYLEMQVNPNPPMSPRIRIVSSAYSYIAKIADTANYAQNAPLQRPITPPISTNEISDNAITSIKILDGTIMGADLNQMGASSGQVLKWTGTSWTPANDSAGGLPSGPAGGDLTGTYPNPVIANNAVTSEKILDGTILRSDVANNFKAPYADTADYVRYAPANVDSARVAGDAHRLQGKDTSYFAPATHTHPYVDSCVGASRVGGLNLAGLDSRFVNEGQNTGGDLTGTYPNPTIANNAVTSAKILDGTILRSDVASNFKAPYADTADYVRYAPASVDSARVAGDAHKLQGKDTSYFAPASHTHSYVDSCGGASRVGGLSLGGLDDRFINENQTAGGDLTGTYPNPTIANNAVTSAKIQDGTIVGADLNQMGASSGQVLKWTGTTWAPRNDTFDNAWIRIGSDSVLYTKNRLGIARGGSNNMLYGNYHHTHVNFGIACTTGSVFNPLGCVVSGGYMNRASGDYSTVSGGASNKAMGDYSIIGGGMSNTASGIYATVAGGYADTASNEYSTVGGGYRNVASGYSATVGGGLRNTASNYYATVGGGRGNTAISSYATVGGGYENTASGDFTTISGGERNTASVVFATVAGGTMNTASGNSAAIGGGSRNVASSFCATVAGGYGDTSAGTYSFTTNCNSIVPSSYSNSAAFNGQTATASNQLRCGILSQGGGLFTIDHPLDPYNKILNHYFIEGPEMRNIYEGSVILDANGRAEVKLPNYFSALNRNPHIQLTGVGTSDVYVLEDVKDNRFVIGGKPGTKVYWLVTGERADVSAEVIRRLMPVEQEKIGELSGRMLDDEFLSGCMEQLEREGKASGINFRTAEGRKRYEDMKRAPKELEREIKK
ncbi:MAG: hypothetical protein ABIK72_05655 [candidate division WOR-3 bacterium]